MNNQNTHTPPEKMPDHKRAPHKKTSPLKIALTVILVIILASVLVAGSVVLIGIYKKPSASADTSVPFELPETLVFIDNKNPETSDDGRPAQPNVGDIKIKDGCYNFLLIGRDRVALNTDVIMIMSFDVDSHKINVVQIPRDTYTEINSVSYKINALYGLFYNEANAKGEKDPSKASLEKLSSTLEQNLNIKIHYYAIINLEGFRNVVDILGGVEVDIQADMDYNDEDQNLHIHLKKGKQLLDGNKAEQFVRFRSGYIQADIGRMDAQKIFLSALIKKVKDNFNITTIVQLATEAMKNVETSLSLTDCIYFAKQFLSVDMSNINFMSMPGESAREYVTSGLWYYVMYRDNMCEIVNKYLNIYNFVITDSMFDKNHFFSSSTKSHISSLYGKSIEIKDAYTADGINDGDIVIPRR